MNSAPPAEDYTARARLFGGNRMKLGVMAFNCSHGSTITTVPEAWKLDWPDTKDIAQAVDRSGMPGLRVTRIQHYKSLYERQQKY
mgnify:CR=1 FL=1